MLQLPQLPASQPPCTAAALYRRPYRLYCLQAVVSLPVQYRMAADIMALPNALIYGDALRCGTGAACGRACECPWGVGINQYFRAGAS